MGSRVIIFDEPIHHTCLMYGLKETFGNMPHLNKRVLNVKGETVLADKYVAPPPMMSNPAYRRYAKRADKSLIEVSYWREKLDVELNDELCNLEEISTFVETLVKEYLRVRHPFTRVCVEQGRVVESSCGELLATIM
jgi:hypothetical protein